MLVLRLPLKQHGTHCFVETQIEHDVRFEKVRGSSSEVVEVETVDLGLGLFRVRFGIACIDEVDGKVRPGW